MQASEVHEKDLGKGIDARNSESVEGKTCTSCHLYFSLDQFYRKNTGKFGRQEKCKKCSATYAKVQNKKHKNKRQARALQYYKENQEKKKYQQKQYRLNNQEKVKQQRKKYYEKHRSKLLEQKKEYYHNNKSDIKEKRKLYVEQNRHKVNAAHIKRKVQKKQATPPWADLQKIEHVYWVCNFISEITGIKHHVDHVHPLLGKTICGLHVHTNLQILTAEENMKKGNTYNANL